VQDGNDIDQIILGGGGAFFFKHVIQQAFPRHKLTELKDALYANVIGFQLAGMESMRSDWARDEASQAAEPDAPFVATSGNLEC